MPSSFYESQLAVLAGYAFCAMLFEHYVLKRYARKGEDGNDSSHGRKASTSGDTAIARGLSQKYLVVYGIVMAADWLQGPYVYSLYREQYGYSEHMVATLFVAGFLSAGLAAPTVGVWADNYGRKRICMIFCLTYIATCFCTFVNWLPINFLGRVFGGISTAILFSCFDSWLVSASQTAGISSSDLSGIFGSATMINGLVAAAVGVFSNGLVARTHTFTSPFAASAVCLGVAWMLIGSMWSENYGSRTESATVDFLQIKRLREAWGIVKQDSSMIVLGLVQTCFEGSMYLFVFLWVPSMQELAARNEELPLGYIFSAFMISMMLGSLFYKCMVTYASGGESTLVLHAKLSSFTLLTASFALAVNNLAQDSHWRFWAFCLFEACVGVYYPVQGMLRGTMIQNDHRATLSSLFRIPLNIFVIVALMSGVSSARHLVFSACTVALAFGSVMTGLVIKRHGMLAVPVLLSLASGAFAASAADWQSRSIYQVITDRFATSDGSGPSCDTAARKYCGGTYKGITNHLDYIQGMGFDAIWISPITKNIGGTTGYGEAYHGYWPMDLYNLNDGFGSADDLKELSAALHKRGMYLMVDVVVNHFAATSTPPSLTYGGYTPFNAETDYHPFCLIEDYNNQTQVEQCKLARSTVVLTDINTESDNVVNTYNAWIKNLTSVYSIDGIRIDTVKHVRKDFWPEFVKSSGVFSIGEVLSNLTDYTGDYTNYMDAVLDYPSWFAVTQAFASTTGNIALIAQNIPETQKHFKNGGISTGAFLENHDQPRFQSWTTDLSLVKNAMAYTFVTDGIPILYYGQEQGYTGGHEPASREALWFTSYQTENKPLVDHVAKLNAARKASIAGDSKFLSTQMKVVANNTHNIAVQKGKLLTALTNVGSQGAAENFELSGTGYSANEQLVDVLSCTNVTADASGNVNVAFKSGNPQVIIPISQLSGSGLCGSAKSASTTSKNNGAAALGFASAFVAAVVGVVGVLPLVL